MKTLAALLAIATLTTAQCCHSVPCPEELGDCNKCIMSNGQVVALTRNICGDYTLEKCRNVYFGNDAGLSDDGCNTCTCGEKGAMCTLKGCPAYDRDRCLKEHGPSWDCEGSTCHCTDCGLGFSAGK